jgi:hypothetical protein
MNNIQNRFSALHAAARVFASKHKHIEFTLSQTAKRFETTSCGNGYNLIVILESNFAEHGQTIFKQTIWDDGDATPVLCAHDHGLVPLSFLCA